MKYLRFSLLTLILGFVSAVSMAETADGVMAKSAEQFKKSPSITANYTATAKGDVVNGKIVVAADKFALTSSALSTWFDGKTQWTLDSKTNEVNVTEPTNEELQQINPFAIISTFRKSYKSKMLKAQKGQYKIELRPVDRKAEISHAIVVFNASTYLPVELQMTTPNGLLVIKVKNAVVGGQLPQTTFRFDKAKYPKAKIVDLR